jgi:predicted enzyme related to lactoylglutathione lyase
VERPSKIAKSNPAKEVMANPFAHVELNTTDLSRAKNFYGSLFDWKLEDFPMEDGTYTFLNVGEGTGGGMLKNAIPGELSMWLAYVLVDDIQDRMQKAKSLGATIIKGCNRNKRLRVA